MKNFQLLNTNIDVLTLNHQIQRQSELWDKNTLRTTYPNSPHADVHDIWVWFNEMQTDAFRVIDDLSVISYPAWHCLPAIQPIVFGVMAQVQGIRLGRVIITKLPPGKVITPHKDQGAPAHYFDRYQLALQCLPGNIFMIEQEQVSFKTGELWWIDNTKEHSVINNSADDRIVCIIDVKCGQNKC